MEYLSGGQLKRIFERRLKETCKRLQQLDRQSSMSDHESECLDFKNMRVSSPIFTEEETAQIIKHILKGLAPLHDLNYIHRDIKPENIILAPLHTDVEIASPCKIERTEEINLDQSQLKIVDFGFSARYKLNPLAHILNEKIGTILFMAPEQISKQSYGRVSLPNSFDQVTEN